MHIIGTWIWEQVENVTWLYPVSVNDVFIPQSVQEIQDFVKNTNRPISTWWGRYSMWGQIWSLGNHHIDMRSMNNILSFEPGKKEITVESWVTWRKIIEHIDPSDLSIKIMQTYASFTVWGSLSVNCHWRYNWAWPLIQSVKSIRIINARGELIHASPKENKELFYGAIWWYGMMGIIIDATLELENNSTLKREFIEMPLGEYEPWYAEQVRWNVDIILHNADIKADWKTVTTENWRKSSEQANTKSALRKFNTNKIRNTLMSIIWELPWGRQVRENHLQPMFLRKKEIICPRNYEATHDVWSLEPLSRENRTFVLQEYFVPVWKIEEFSEKMHEIFERHKANVINVSIRNSTNDPGTYLKWADGEVFSFVIYYKQKTDKSSQNEVAVWTRELTEAAIWVEGRYYLPYQIHQTIDQIEQAYPRLWEFMDLKDIHDPRWKFSNTLYEAIKRKKEKDNWEAQVLESRFKSIFQNDEWRDKFYLFLQNIFSIAPTKDIYTLIHDIVEQYDTDEEIYNEIQKWLKKVKPILWDLKYGIPSLKKQKDEMVNQTLDLLAEITEWKNFKVDGYLEIGWLWRYKNTLEKELDFSWENYFFTEEKQSYSPVHILERWQIGKLNNASLLTYDTSDFNQIPDNSLSMIAIYIGIHHCPAEQLNAFNKQLYKKLKPGGILIIRDHNAHTPMLKEMAWIAHDVFNVGTWVSPDVNFSEYRNFMSVDEVNKHVEEVWFIAWKWAILQDNDPTLNSLIYFQKPWEIECSEQISSNNSHKRYTSSFKNWVNSINERERQTVNYRKESSEHIPQNKLRAFSQTFLSAPEWMTVYMPRDFWEVLKNSPPSAFPYFQAISDLRHSHGRISELTKKFPQNKQYDDMLTFTQVFTSIEYWVKWLYEKSIWKLFEKLWYDTNEDQVYNDFACDYAAFIDETPWYEYDFWTSLSNLLRAKTAPWVKKLRSLERKFIIWSELIFKLILWKVIKKASQSTYWIQDSETYVEMKISSKNDIQQIPWAELIEELWNKNYMVKLPRYQLIDILDTLSNTDFEFNNIAWNEDIVACLRSNDPEKLWKLYSNNTIMKYYSELLWEQRKFICIPVTELKNLHKQISKHNITIENIYDY